MKQLMFALLGLIFLSGPAVSQELVRIAAVVNDNVISMLDVLARVKMAALATGLEDSPEVRQQLVQPVLRTLIEEQLQAQEAERQGVTLSEDELRNGLEMFEQQNGLSLGQLNEWLASIGIPRIFLERQIQAQILWGKFIVTRLRPQVVISEEDVEDEVARLQANRGRPEYLISQIDLYFEGSSASEGGLLATAHQLVKQIRGGAQFEAIAAQFSQNAMGNYGGDMGWMGADQLRPELARVVAEMDVGGVSDPILTTEALHIVRLRDRRKVLVSDPSKIRVQLLQITLPVPDESDDNAVASQSAFAEQVRSDIDGCGDMASVAEELNSGTSGDLGWVFLNDLPEVFRKHLLKLEIGVPSPPVRSEFGVHLVMVCDRDDPNQSFGERETVRARMEMARLEVLARRLLRDLRRSAFVDLRV